MNARRNKKDPMKKALLLMLTLSCMGCATYRPILDENKAYKKAGSKKAEGDIDICMTKADKYLAKYKNDRVKKQAGRTALLGGLFGTVGGTLHGSPTSVVEGGAIGAAAGGATGAGMAASKDQLTPDEVKQHYVTHCLDEKGYKVIGWR
jgi:hypothetical protein